MLRPCEASGKVTPPQSATRGASRMRRPCVARASAAEEAGRPRERARRPRKGVLRRVRRQRGGHPRGGSPVRRPLDGHQSGQSPRGTSKSPSQIAPVARIASSTGGQQAGCPPRGACRLGRKRFASRAAAKMSKLMKQTALKATANKQSHNSRAAQRTNDNAQPKSRP